MEAIWKADCASEELRDVLKSVASVLTCQVCQEVLVDPFALQCGHLFCAPCIVHWFQALELRQKTCPMCRQPARSEPVPVHQLRDLAQAATRLLTTVDAAEGVAVERRFRESTQGSAATFAHLKFSNGPVFDEIDGVERCQVCHWELEDGVCPRCGEAYDVSFNSDNTNAYESRSDAQMSDELQDEDFSAHSSDNDFIADNSELMSGPYTTENELDILERAAQEQERRRPGRRQRAYLNDSSEEQSSEESSSGSSEFENGDGNAIEGLRDEVIELMDSDSDASTDAPQVTAVRRRHIVNISDSE